MKNSFIRILTVLTASLLFVVTAGAAEAPDVNLKATPSSVDVGDSFTIYVEFDDNAGFEAFEGGLSYDADVLTCTAIKSGTVLKDNNAMFTSNPKKALFAAISAYPIEGNGTVLEFTFRADAPGNAKVTLADAKVFSGSNTYSVTSSVSVSVAGSETVPIPDKPSEEIPEIVEPEVPEISFSDVPKTHWAYTYIQNAVQNGLFSGIGNGQFGPGMNVTRGMFVTTLYSSAGSPDVELSNFSDVADNAWYAKAVAWASQKGIVSGIGNNKFGPDLPITREQIALILYNYADGVSPGTEAFVRIGYADGKDIHDWALTAFTWAMNKELIAGKAGNVLDPLATATRAEVAVIMQNFVNLSK